MGTTKRSMFEAPRQLDNVSIGYQEVVNIGIMDGSPPHNGGGVPCVHHREILKAMVPEGEWGCTILSNPLLLSQIF